MKTLAKLGLVTMTLISAAFSEAAHALQPFCEVTLVQIAANQDIVKKEIPGFALKMGDTITTLKINDPSSKLKTLDAKCEWVVNENWGHVDEYSCNITQNQKAGFLPVLIFSGAISTSGAAQLSATSVLTIDCSRFNKGAFKYDRENR